MQLLGSLQGDVALQREALSHFKKLLSKEEWAELGEANLYRDIGECHKMAG